MPVTDPSSAHSALPPEPSSGPTPEPTPGPTPEPTPGPTSAPTPEPTSAPTPEPTVATQAGGTRFGGLDGLRAVAVGAVVLHNTSGALPGGYAGVILFFVISGFLITSLLDREYAATGRIRLGAFYLRRAYRLFPALAEALVLLVLLTWRQVDPAVIGKAVLYVACYVWNWGGVLYPSPGVPGFWGPLWSLSVEEQFYLVWPLVLLGLLTLLRARGAQRRIGALVWIVISLAAAGTAWRTVLWARGASGGRVYVGTDTRGDALLLGAALALAAARSPRLRRWLTRRQSWLLPVGAAFLVLCVALAMPDLESPAQWELGPGMILPTLVGLALVGLAVHAEPTALGARVLASRPLVYLGERSYAIYLFHLPVAEALPRGGAAKLASYLVTLALAELSYRFVETPVRRRVPAWARQR